MGSESQDNKENPEGVSAEGSEGSVGAHSEGGSTGAPLIAESEYLTPGEKFGDYQVLSCLSFGMLGGIYRMQHIIKFHEATVAVLPIVAKEREGFQERYESNATLLTHLTHPNIATVTGYEEIKDQPCLLMEPIEGINLQEYMEEIIQKKLRAAGALDPNAAGGAARGQVVDFLPDQAFGLPPSEVQEILRQTIEGIKASHSTKIFHHNLDPTKLIRQEDGTIKIVGLGILEIVGPELLSDILASEIPPITMGPRKVIINTGDTLSPEVREGGEPDLRSDIHSLGVSGYFLLTGHKPTVDKIPPSQYSAAIQPGWDEVLGRCLEDAPGDRYANLNAFQNDVGRVDKIAVKAPSDEAGIAAQIERIPVPKEISRRLDPEKLKYFRLGIIGLFAAIVIGLASVFYTIIFSEAEVAQGPIVKRVKVGQEPMVDMTLKPAQARVVFFGRGESSFVVQDGKLKVVMPRMEFEVKVSAKNHLPRTISIKVENELLRVALALKPSWALFEVKTVPGARIVMTRGKEAGIDLGPVPEDGLLRVEETIYSGTYRMEVIRENYEPAEVAELVLPTDQLVKQEIELNPIPGKMRIVTQPEGARVSVDGRDAGITPLSLEELTVGAEMKFSVSLEEYRTKARVITLPPGFDDVLDFGDLVRKMGAVDTQVELNGEAINDAEKARITTRIAGQTVYGVVGFIPKVLAGTQDLEIEHPDYEIWRDRVRVVDQRKTTVEVDLKPRPGKLTVKLNVSLPYKVVADGRVVEGENDEYSLVSGVNHELEIRVRDHLTAKRNMKFGPNERRNLEVKLVPIPGPEKSKQWFVPYVGTDMLWVNPGEFRMGSPPTEQARLPVEGPQTTVVLTKGFWLGKYEVTQQEYRAVMNTNPSEFKGLRHPVERVSWKDAVEFCGKITVQERKAGRLPEGYEYRLPTQAEWEYSCRAGTSTPFQFGEKSAPSMGNFKGGYPREYSESLPEGKKIYGTTSVGSYEENDFGFYDMHGNVREICLDNFNSRLPGGRETDWVENRQSSDRVNRGGGWEDFAHQARSASRQRVRLTSKGNSLGFRLALAPEISD